MTEIQSKDNASNANGFLHNSLFHVIGFAVYPIFFLYIRNRDQINFGEVAVASVASVLIASCLLLFLNIFLRHLAKSGLAVSYFFFYFFSYGPAFESLHLNGFVGRARHFWPALLWSLLCLYCLYKIIKTKYFIREITLFFNVTALTFCLISAFHLVKIPFQKKTSITSQTNRNKKAFPQMNCLDGYISQAMKLQAKRPLPDIYYFILDGYARQDILKDMYGYDNSSFIDFLESRGFFVANNSVANYCQTNLSLASSLNSIYLDEFANIKTNSVAYSKSLISDAAICKILRIHGYEIVSLQSHSSLYDLKRCSDRHISYSEISNAFLALLVRTSILSAFDLPYLSTREAVRKSLREKIEDAFSIPPEIRLGNKPIFFFVHIPCPHPPFFFGPNGEKKEVDDPTSSADGSHMGITSEEYRRGYLDQLRYVNLRTRKLVEKLLSLKQKRQRIIILQSDHGPGSELNWEDAGKTNMKERMSILNAIYYSEGPLDGLNHKISPVNTFRLILNHLFHSEINILADRSYFSIVDRRYEYIDVTDKVSQ